MGSQLHSPLPPALCSARSLRRIFPDPYSLSALLYHCSSPTLLRYGQQAHAIALTSFLAAQPLVAAHLIGMYSACCIPTAASLVFNTAPNSALSNRVLWTTLIAGLVRNGDHRAAMEKFRTMQVMGVQPNNFTLPTVLSACASERELRFGCQVHGCALRTGFGASPFVQSSLVGLYSNCSDLASAKRVLQTSSSDDPVPWNTLIVSCARSAQHEHALSFVQMHLRGLSLDEFTFPSALNSAAFSGDSGIGRCIHCLVLRSGFDSHRHVANALVDMYVKLRDFTHGRRVFDQMPERDVVAWTSLLVGHARQGSHEVALQLYSAMLAHEVEPDEFAVAGVLSSCASSTALELGRQVHAAIVHRGLHAFVSVSNALITMYARSGCIDEAHVVFEKSLCRRDAVTWTALIMGYAQNGRSGDSLRLYDAMLAAGARPDYVTFIGLIFACSHAGLVESGRVHFESMEKVYGITPGPEHYSCMVDLLGRAGRVEEAVELLGRMDGEPDATVWKSLLAACRVHRNIPLAERAAERLFKLAPEDAVPYVMLANVYTAAGRWLDVARVRSLMRARGVSKEPGWSWMEEGGAVHAFKAGDREHAQAKEIFAKVREMMQRIKEEGYWADTGFALHDEEEEGKAAELAVHSERLAVAWGLISSASHGKPIRVYKNLRVCGDCHTALKLIAKVYDKVIILRDANCFHHMRDGICSCGDYW